MSKDVPPAPGGSGLLSKVVKFVKSPTTHWADLDKPAAEDGGGESRLMLKEMIERKRRNDFVRNREFDMLRKARRREAQRSGAPEAPGPSLFSNSELTLGGERAHTLKKIDEIEAQMSTAWLKRRGGGTPAGDTVLATALHELAPRQPNHVTAEPQLAEAPLDKTQLDELFAQSEPIITPRALAPTLSMDQAVLPPTSLPVVGDGADVPGVAAGRPNLAFGESEPSMEVAFAARQDHELEEAAIRFANGDAAGAEAALRALVSESEGRSGDMDIWLTLFDLYRCMGDANRFDEAAGEFAARFGRSAPQWARIGESVSVIPAPAATAAPAAVRTGPFDWVCPSTLGAASVAALSASLERHGSPWRIDWRHLTVIEAAALPSLVALIQRWADTPGRYDFLAVERLLEALADNARAEDRASDPLWWEARMALLRVLDHMDEFELVALNYCVTYEVSPPAWEAPRNHWHALTEEVPAAHATSEPAAAARFAIVPASDASTPGVCKAVLAGEYVGSADAVVRELAAQDGAQAFELNCRQLTRVDFSAAGDLLNWSMDQQARGHRVTFKQVNRLVAAFFGVIGISDAARVTLRTD